MSTETARPVPEPSFTSRDFVLPEGCFVADHDERTALLIQDVRAAYPPFRFLALDLATGRRTTLLSWPVGRVARLCAYQPRISDGWVAWEEASSDAVDPSAAEWRIYVAPFDRVHMRLGRAVIAARGLQRTASRPFYAIDGDTLRWVTNEVRGGRVSAVLSARDLRSGRSRVIRLFEGPWRAMRLSGGRLVAVETDPDNGRETIVVADPSAGSVALRHELPSGHATSHFPEYVDGRLVWAATSAEGQPWPDLYGREASGATRVLARGAGDPAFFGGLAVYEAIVRTDASGGRELTQLRVLDLATGASTGASEPTRALWQTAWATGATERTAVCTVDLGPLAEQASQRVTVVRVLRAGRTPRRVTPRRPPPAPARTSGPALRGGG